MAWVRSTTPGPRGKVQADDQLHAIVIRGTVDSANSILDDALATSVPANGFLKVKTGDGVMQRLPITMVSAANAENAAVHLGFVWGAAILLYHNDLGILKFIQTLPPGSKILITGHSQGAAIATLLHAMLLQASEDAPGVLPEVLKKQKFQFKSYVFAQPKPGNWQFGHDFGQSAGNRGFAICVNNNRDWVPQVPLSVDLPDEVTGNPIDPYLSAKHPVLKELVSVFGVAARDARMAIGDVAKFWADAATNYLGAHIDPLFLVGGLCEDSSAPYFNYVQCGRLYSLCGVASPNEDQDPLWQHHCGNYANLLRQQGSSFG